MLVLSRQRDESITIVDVRGDKVRLGITAPREIPVHRREIYDTIQREKAAAAAAEKSPAESPEEAPEAKSEEASEDKPEEVSQEQPEKEPQPHK